LSLSLLSIDIIGIASTVIDTRSSAKANVSNDLNCAGCQPNAGRTTLALPLAGLTGVLPQLRASRANVESLERRITNAFFDR
jgi:cytochrome c